MTTTCGPLGVAFVNELGADEIVDISGKPKIDFGGNLMFPLKYILSLEYLKLSLDVSPDGFASGDHFEDALMHKPKFDLVINTLGPWACDSCLYLCKEQGRVVTMLPPILMLTNRCAIQNVFSIVSPFLRSRFSVN